MYTNNFLYQKRKMFLIIYVYISIFTARFMIGKNSCNLLFDKLNNVIFWVVQSAVIYMYFIILHNDVLKRCFPRPKTNFRVLQLMRHTKKELKYKRAKDILLKVMLQKCKNPYFWFSFLFCMFIFRIFLGKVAFSFN